MSKHIWSGVFNWTDLHDSVVNISYTTVKTDYARGYNTALADGLSLIKKCDSEQGILAEIDYSSLKPDTDTFDNFIYGYEFGVLKFKEVLQSNIDNYNK